jgi:ribosome-binding protein aMBF1 (putative translation factor)
MKKNTCALCGKPDSVLRSFISSDGTERRYCRRCYKTYMSTQKSEKSKKNERR